MPRKLNREEQREELERKRLYHEHKRRPTAIKDGYGGYVQECITCYSFLKSSAEMANGPRTGGARRW